NNNGMTAGMNQAAGLLGGYAANNGLTADMRNNINMLNSYAANNGVTGDIRKTADYLTPFASGKFQEDPRLQRQLDINADRAANATATRFGGGRYGSAAIGNAMGSAVADANNATMLQSNENARTRQLQATG